MRDLSKIVAGSLVLVLAGCANPNKMAEAPPADTPAAEPTQVAVIPPPAPPPPPPPPAPPRTSVPAPKSGNDNGRIVVTGSRIQSQNITSPSPVVTIDEGVLAQDSSETAQRQSRSSRYVRIPGVQVADQPDNERYDGEDVSPVRMVANEPVSTFSVDVDTGSYANARRFLSEGRLPPSEAVRTEELINYFRYDYAMPDDRRQPFSVNTDMAITPWNDETRLLRIGLRGYDLPTEDRPAANLVFLLDVSGSMNSRDKLPLVKTAMRQLATRLHDRDRVSIVVYAGAAGVVLEPTNDAGQIRKAIDSLEAGGSTAGGAGIRLAYNIARESFIDGGVNRVILATDGDFNVGVSDRDDLVEMIERERESGVTLTTLGFGTGNYNESMMEQLADHGNGNYAYIDSALEAQKVLSDEMESTLFTIASDVKIQVEFNPELISQYRLIGYENRALREEDFDNDAVDAGEIGAGHQVTAIYEVVPVGANGWVRDRRYTAGPRSVPQHQFDEIAFVQLRYKLPGEENSTLIQQALPASLMQRAGEARGDMAFATAVAAYGQILRGDELMNGYTFDDAVGLAGRQNGFWREEFLQLASLAGSLNAR